MQIAFDGVSKSFGSGTRRVVAVNDVSFDADGGTVFGILGPNGAGKTTMIRMLLDVFRPDTGRISTDGVENGNRSLSFRQRVAYLPEERGLYQKRKIADVIHYIGALRGMEREQIRTRMMPLLERFDLVDSIKKKVSTLSKGMSQKLQIILSVIHDPDMLIFDEPFSGLDPVNVRLVRELVREHRDRGKLVCLSTHMMAEVEALCDRVMMIDHGRRVLYGALDEVRRANTDFQASVNKGCDPSGLPCVVRVVNDVDMNHVYLKDGATLNDLMRELAAAKRPVQRLVEGMRPIEDIFISVAGSAAERDETPPTTPMDAAEQTL